MGQQVLHEEERIEYRDQDGNLLSEEEVSALVAEGNASFNTVYETQTKIIDENGNVVSSVAPEHPDAEGANPDTKGQSQASKEPAEAEVSIDDAREEVLKKPKPASDTQVAASDASPPADASEATK